MNNGDFIYVNGNLYSNFNINPNSEYIPIVSINNGSFNGIRYSIENNKDSIYTNTVANWELILNKLSSIKNESYTYPTFYTYNRLNRSGFVQNSRLGRSVYNIKFDISRTFLVANIRLNGGSPDSSNNRSWWYNNNTLRDDINTVPLSCLCVKKEYLRYVRQCLLLNKPIHPEVFTLFVNSNFDKKEGILPNLRPHFRKHILKYYKNKGIEVKYINNFNSIFTFPNLYENTISKRKEELNNLKLLYEYSIKESINLDVLIEDVYNNDNNIYLQEINKILSGNKVIENTVETSLNDYLSTIA